MLKKPNLLIMDEPDAFLDFDNLKGLKNLLNSYQGTVLAVTHNRYLLNHCFDKIPHLENGDIQEFEGNFTKYRAALLEKKVEMYRHYYSTTDHISESFDKMLEGYFETGVAKKVKLGDAECILCDAKGIFEVTGRILQKEKNCFIERENIPREWYLI